MGGNGSLEGPAGWGATSSELVVVGFGGADGDDIVASLSMCSSKVYAKAQLWTGSCSRYIDQSRV